MASTNDIINNDIATISKTIFDSDYYCSHRIPVILHRREIGKVFAEVNDDLVVIAGENKKEHEYLIPKSKVCYFDEKQLHVSINDNSLKDFEI
ncbi:MAG: hypothetical protein ACRD8Z_10620 [Nitrososphaeraceae archaeon]